jgi:LysM repeat protein
MNTETHQDIQEALRRAERRADRLERALRVHRIALIISAVVLTGVLLLAAFGQRRHFARAIIVDGQTCCLVAAQKDVEAIRKQIIAAARGDFPGEAFIKEKWEDATEEVDDRPVLSVAEGIEALRDKVTVHVAAAAINVKGVNVAVLASEELAHRALDTLKSQYIGDESSKVISQTLEPEPSIGTVDKPPDEISTDIRQVVTQLRETRREPMPYVIKTGDYPEKIAGAHGIPVKELWELNPGLRGRTIHPGETIKVGIAVPAVTVVTITEVTRNETIEPPVKKRYSPAVKRGQTQVEAEGKPGKRTVTYRITRRNDKRVAKEILHEKIVEKPQPRKLLIGTGDAS